MYWRCTEPKSSKQSAQKDKVFEVPQGPELDICIETMTFTFWELECYFADFQTIGANIENFPCKGHYFVRLERVVLK